MRPTLADQVRPTGTPTQLGEQSGVAILGDSRADVAREALKIARTEALTRPVLLVDLLGQDSALGQMCTDEDPHGVSDAARYGVSLSKVARPVPNADALYLVPGGAESPLEEDVLRDGIWGSWTEQCRRAGALLVVAGPADLPAVGRAVDQLDGLVMIGDATPPPTHAPMLGRIPTTRRRAASADIAAAPRRISPEELAVIRQATPRLARRILLFVTLGVLVAAVVAAWAVVTGRVSLPAFAGNTARAATPASATGTAVAAVAPSPPGTLEWSVEIASVSSLTGAIARVRQSMATLPVPTLAAGRPSGAGPTWYRLLAGAYARSSSADSLLNALRDRGLLDPGGGQVVRTPRAWHLEDVSDMTTLDERLFGWRTLGVPAYALFDSVGIARIYAGAFESDSAALLLRPLLDSLNLHATLTARVGSVR